MKNDNCTIDVGVINEGELKSKVFSGMFWKFGERFLAQGISFIVSIVLARLLMPNDYGIVAIVNVFITIADVLVTSGLGTSLIQKKESDQKDFSTIFYCSLAFGVFLYATLFFIAPIISSAYNKAELTNIIRVFALKIPISSINSIQSAFVSKHMMFKKFFYSTLIGTLTSGVVGIIMALNGFGVWALIAQYLTNSIMDTVILFLTVKWKPSLMFSWGVAKPLISYGWKVMCTDLIGTIFNQLSAFMIGIEYTSEDIAYYTKGKSFPELINNNIFTTLGSVLFPALSKVSDDYERTKIITKKSIKLASYVLYPLMFGMIVVADNMIKVLLTEKWNNAVVFVQLAAAAGIAGVVSTINLQSIKGLGRSDITLKLEFIKKPFFIACLTVAIRINVLCIGFVLPIIAVFETIVNMCALSKLIDYRIKEQLIDILPAFMLSITMSFVVYLISYLEIPAVLILIIQVLLGITVYLLASVLLRVEQFAFILSIFKKKEGK